MSNRNKWSFILNPTAGSGSGAVVLKELEKQLARRSLNATVHVTERHKHATELSQKSLEDDCTHIIAVGGDGTMNEVAQPLIGREKVLTGLVPAGTGNDFIQILGFPDRFDEVHWDAFFQQSTIKMDVGRVNGLYFLNGMGLGFDAQVAAKNYTEPGDVARKGGKGKYLWHIISTLLGYRERKARIHTSDRQQESPCFMNTIAIGRRFAGDFLITPDAIANDGLLDICMIKKVNLLQRFKILPMVPKGTHIQDPRVEYYQTGAIRVEFNEKVPFHLDGELHFDSTFEVDLIPTALRIIYNQEGKHFFNV